MPWTINAEIYPLHARNLCCGISTAINWICNLFVSLTFLSITERFTVAAAFWIYATCALVGWIFLFRKLPETKGVLLEDIQSVFGGCKTQENQLS